MQLQYSFLLVIINFHALDRSSRQVQRCIQNMTFSQVKFVLSCFPLSLPLILSPTRFSLETKLVQICCTGHAIPQMYVSVHVYPQTDTLCYKNLSYSYTLRIRLYVRTCELCTQLCRAGGYVHICIYSDNCPLQTYPLRAFMAFNIVYQCAHRNSRVYVRLSVSYTRATIHLRSTRV